MNRVSYEQSSNLSMTSEGSHPDEPDDNLPSVKERLAYLRPSRELLEYYRKKIAEYDTEHEDLMKRIEDYKGTYEDQHAVQWELRQREAEITELQKALSDMQVFLFQEREHVLRLYAENDRLKIRELEDRKKIHTLLQISGLTESEVSYFLKEPPAKAIVEQHLPKKLHNELANTHQMSQLPGTKRKPLSAKENRKDRQKGVEEERYKKDNHTLTLQVEALQAQLEEQTKLAKEQVEGLLEDRRVKIEEADTLRHREEDKVKNIQEKLHKTQDLLYDSTRDFLALRFQHRGHERTWMTEKDKLMRDLDSCHKQIEKYCYYYPTINSTSNTAGTSTGGGTVAGTADIVGGPERMFVGGPEGIARRREKDLLAVKFQATTRDHKKDEEIKSLQYQLGQTQRLADMYREQVMTLEDKFARIREEGDVGKELFKDRSEKMSKRLQLMNQRYAELEKRRNLEVEGFKSDIKLLRGRLKDLEKQLYKVTIGLSEDIDGKARPEDIDMQILRNIRRTAGRSKDMFGELKHLKAKVYGLENDLKHL